MREPSAAPAEFVSYVDRRLRPLEAAALRLTDDEVQAERIARDLLTLVALRWWWLTRSDARRELSAGTSADFYLTKRFQQEADEFGYPRMILNLDAAVTGRRRPTFIGPLPISDEAAYIWETARQRLRRRLLIAAAIAGVVTVAAVCRRGGSQAQSQQPQQLEPPLVQSTELPPGAFILPGGGFDTGQIESLPAELKFPAARPPALSESPLPRAILLAGSPTLDEGRVYALADNGNWRYIDAAPERAGAWMSAAALSPAGKQAVFATPAATVIVDLTTGAAKPVPGIARVATSPVWLSEQQLLLGRDALFDVPGGQTGQAPAGPEDAITPRRREPGDRTTTLSELLSAGQPLTAPARLRQWQLDQSDPQPAIRPLTGRLADIVGRWQGNGFGFGDDRVTRMCLPGNLAGRAQANAAIVVITPKTAEVVRALLIDTSVSGVPGLLGWLDERRVLLTLAKGGSGGYQQILAWDLLSDRMTRVSMLDFAGTISLRDLSSAPS
ncbi:hypothetical protein [Allorhizocola rhizosphaerae]|uniref:hypothetical protein n=1 Tax=Allorhizocola rhizosphaerae TaxID=1872709 RepID=UPI000E3D7C45|nr:hypothetical protein [Allorhizocola rhizosphaerae]